MADIINHKVTKILYFNWTRFLVDENFPVPRFILLSEKMKIHGEEIFQAGQLWNLLFKEDELWAQNPGVAHVLFKTLNPAKLGLDILNVKFYNEWGRLYTLKKLREVHSLEDFHRDAISKMLPKKNEDSSTSDSDEDTAKNLTEDSDEDSYLYAVHFRGVNPTDHLDHSHFILQVSGTVPAYQLKRSDVLLFDLLWDSARFEKGADFELIAEGHAFKVHKFILAARSPIFTEKFTTTEYQQDQEITETVKNTKASTFKRFLIFIYTGVLMGAVSDELLKLAEFFKIKTLTELCQAALTVSTYNPLLDPLDTPREESPQTL